MTLYALQHCLALFGLCHLVFCHSQSKRGASAWSHGSNDRTKAPVFRDRSGLINTVCYLAGSDFLGHILDMGLKAEGRKAQIIKHDMLRSRSHALGVYTFIYSCCMFSISSPYRPSAELNINLPYQSKK